jgi:hypothetical protein
MYENFMDENSKWVRKNKQKLHFLPVDWVATRVDWSRLSWNWNNASRLESTQSFRHVYRKLKIFLKPKKKIEIDEKPILCNIFYQTASLPQDILIHPNIKKEKKKKHFLLINFTRIWTHYSQPKWDFKENHPKIQPFLRLMKNPTK